jgi:hypothetical protein
LKIGVVPMASPTMRGSQKMRPNTATVTAAASQRSAGQALCSATQAMPGTISASATVSQPFSSARLSASASEAMAPVAKMAEATSLPGRSSRLLKASVARAKAPASSTAAPAKGSERSKPAMR